MLFRCPDRRRILAPTKAVRECLCYVNQHLVNHVNLLSRGPVLIYKRRSRRRFRPRGSPCSAITCGET